jgi:hypothetical protein
MKKTTNTQKHTPSASNSCDNPSKETFVRLSQSLLPLTLSVCPSLLRQSLLFHPSPTQRAISLFAMYYTLTYVLLLPLLLLHTCSLSHSLQRLEKRSIAHAPPPSFVLSFLSLLIPNSLRVAIKRRAVCSYERKVSQFRKM